MKTEIRSLKSELDRIRRKAAKWRILADIKRSADEEEPEQLARRSVSYGSILYFALEDE